MHELPFQETVSIYETELEALPNNGERRVEMVLKEGKGTHLSDVQEWHSPSPAGAKAARGLDEDEDLAPRREEEDDGMNREG